MLNHVPNEIYISTANADMRKGLDGFASIVEQQFRLDPMSSAMFVFHNRHCDKVKILYWDGDGYCLLHKRIEHGKFHFPKKLLEDNITRLLLKQLADCCVSLGKYDEGLSYP